VRSTILRPWPPRRAPRDELARGPARGPAPLQARAAGAPGPQPRGRSIPVLPPRCRHPHAAEPSQASAAHGARAPAAARAAGLAAAPPGAVVGTVWLAPLPARGARGRPAASRRSPRSVSGRRSQPLARRHGQQAGASGRRLAGRSPWPCPPRAYRASAGDRRSGPCRPLFRQALSKR